MTELVTTIEGKEIIITTPDKPLWPEAGITKLDYIKYLLTVSPHMLPYAAVCSRPYAYGLAVTLKVCWANE
ncbi:MAG TPA: hypothetical protein VMS09_15175 [Paenibacillus sp.]|uniref:hypothetical protein n=1 Tax=Paenibacillus sp. TaxID=58172 RepID=UPI0028D8A801|nr:hypothetical protein [Paenibacillus sp.]HUC93342.1 hypothetical protein [Paenibacillus sp.]